MFKATSSSTQAGFPGSFWEPYGAFTVAMTAISFKTEQMQNLAVKGSCYHLILLAHFKLVHSQLWGLHLRAADTNGDTYGWRTICEHWS